jgi:hypothetical protein
MSRNRQPNPARLVGKTYGELTVTAVALNTPGRETLYRCRCICGREVIEMAVESHWGMLAALSTQ